MKTTNDVEKLQDLEWRYQRTRSLFLAFYLIKNVFKLSRYEVER